MSPTPDAPLLSAILVVGESRDRAERSLACLQAQTALDTMEIIVPDIFPEGSPLRGADHPSVRVVALPSSTGFCQARAEGARAARGEMIAFIEDHSYAAPEWAAAVIDAFRKPAAIVNYALSSPAPRTYITRALLMTEYGPWHHPVRPGYITHLAGNNIAYHRNALEPYWERLGDHFEMEFQLQRSIIAAGGRAWIEPRARIEHENFRKLSGGLTANRALKRMLAARRAVEGNWGRAHRVAFAAAMVLSPPLHFWRLLRTLWNRPALWGLFLASLPVILVVYASSAIAEATGYLAGAGTSREDHKAAELSVTRNQ